MTPNVDDVTVPVVVITDPLPRFCAYIPVSVLLTLTVIPDPEVVLVLVTLIVPLVR